MSILKETAALATRRHFFGRMATGIGIPALASLLNANTVAHPPLPGFPHHAPKAKRIIYLHQSGAPSQMDLFDPKPQLKSRFAEDLPDSIRKGQRLTGMTSGQKSFPVAPSKFNFAQHGQSGTWFSELLPGRG